MAVDEAFWESVKLSLSYSNCSIFHNGSYIEIRALESMSTNMFVNGDL